jgi:hypothetical protein
LRQPFNGEPCREIIQCFRVEALEAEVKQLSSRAGAEAA